MVGWITLVAWLACSIVGWAAGAPPQQPPAWLVAGVGFAAGVDSAVGAPPQQLPAWLVAGVGIGSLYQYFPSKEALVAGVVERHTQELLEVARDRFVKAEADPIETSARALVAAAIDAHRVDPTLHRVLAEEIPHTGRLANIDAVEQNSQVFLRGYLEAHRDEIDVADLDLAAFILVTTVEALTHSAVLRRPDLLANERVEGFVDEVARLVVRYLRIEGRRESAKRL